MTQTSAIGPGSDWRGGRGFGGLAGRYRALRDKLKQMLERRDGDYGRMTALAQEFAQVRRTLRVEILRRRHARRIAIRGGNAARNGA